MSVTDFKFKEKRNFAVFTVKQIMLENKPILFVGHNKEDGAWQFLSGDLVKAKDAMLVSLEELVAKDPTLNDIADLPKGWQASRSSIKEDWFRVQVP
jgi:hypothetical protein